jgi:type VI secretion system protein ImpH
MVSATRPTDAAVNWTAQLAALPQRFDDRMALRYLECSAPHAARLGRGLKPATEPVRLREKPHLGMVASSIADYVPGNNSEVPVLSCHHFGLLGPNGPLPLHLSELVANRETMARDLAPGRFLDVFHHRMMSFFYRAWADARPEVEFDRPEANRFSAYLDALTGLAGSGPSRDAMPDHTKRFYVGWLSQGNSSREGLVSMLKDYFGVPFRLTTFVPRWCAAPQRDRAMLGGNALSGTSELARQPVLGNRVRVAQQCIDIDCGPLSLADFRLFLPKFGGRLAEVVATVRNYAGDFVDWRLKLHIKAEERPSTALGRSGELGWTAWLGDRVVGSMVEPVSLEPVRYTRGEHRVGTTLDRE